MDIEKYIYSECQSPNKVKIYNGVTNCYEIKDVPCGKCYHCKITRINEWVTRMVIQSNMSNYVYYGTLTYGSKKNTLYHNETLAVMTDFNKTKSYTFTPTILRKDHLQKFFKRLRKNTGVKLQYAACGEYGGTYSRPHFHYIMWSNEPISKIDIYKAWTAPLLDDPKKRVCLGKVEHRDIKHNAYPAPNDPDNTFVYKYVCKYIQKTDFNFDKLTNFEQHKDIYDYEFKPLTWLDATTYSQDSRLDDYLKSKKIASFDDYKKVFSPFYVCSKKPAIGYQYLEKHLDEFQAGNFRLFGLSGKYIFPLYFVRKTKEKICPLKAQSETYDGATSYSRLPKMASLIDNIQTALQFAESTNYAVQLFWCDNQIYHYETSERLQDLQELRDHTDTQPNRTRQYLFKREYLGLHDIENKVYYSFRGDYFAMYDSKDNYIGTETLENVKQLILYYYDRLKRKVLLPLLAKSAISANKKAALIEECGGIDRFNEIKEQCVEQLNNKIAERQRKYKLTKTFE